MSQQLSGNLKGLAHSEIKRIERLFNRKIDKNEIVPLDLAREIHQISAEISRKIGMLVSREGKILEVFVGNKNILYLPDLGRYRLAKGRLRRVRLLFPDLTQDSTPAKIPTDNYTDLEKLRLDMVVSIKCLKNKDLITYAHITPENDSSKLSVSTVEVKDLGAFDFELSYFMEELEAEILKYSESHNALEENSAIIVGVYEKNYVDVEGSILEIHELARTAGVKIVDTITQKRNLDPRTLLGKGKLEELVLTCLRYGAEMIIFDRELKPTQWRSITNQTELKVLDRSMLILDIFAQRATSADGRLQVELAQLKYNLPRLVEKDSGLSRLSGGIGGRGPGETKLEIGRRRIRDRISELEKRIDKLGEQRDLRKSRRMDSKVPQVAILGYTNVGKSTLFNILTNSNILAENKLFATLDTSQRKLAIQDPGDGTMVNLVMSDTVGFIRDLPNELRTAFRATLEELNDATILMHVLDASDPRISERKKAVDAILTEMNLTDIPQIIVLNKIDNVDQETSSALKHEMNAMLVSAKERTGIEELKHEILRTLKYLKKNEEDAVLAGAAEEQAF